MAHNQLDIRSTEADIEERERLESLSGPPTIQGVPVEQIRGPFSPVNPNAQVPAATTTTDVASVPGVSQNVEGQLTQRPILTPAQEFQQAIEGLDAVRQASGPSEFKSNVTAAQAVPFGRTVAEAAELKALRLAKKAAFDELQVASPVDNPREYQAALLQFKRADFQLSKRAARTELANRPLEKPKYATGSPFGYVLKHDETGKVIESVYGNEDGPSTIPSVRTVVQMNTQAVTNEATKALVDGADQATRLLVNDFDRLGVSQDVKDVLGDLIIDAQANTLQAQIDPEGKLPAIRDRARDIRTISKNLVQITDPEFTVEQTGTMSTGIIDVGREREDFANLSSQAVEMYNQIKGRDNRQEGGITAVIMRDLVTSNPEKFADLSSESKFRLFNQMGTAIETMRSQNLQTELSQYATSRAKENKEYHDMSINQATSLYGGGPTSTYNTLNKQAPLSGQGVLEFQGVAGSTELFNEMEMSSAAQVQQFQKELSISNEKLENIPKARQRELLEPRILARMGQVINDLPEDKRASYASWFNEVKASARAGTLPKTHPDVNEAVNLGVTQWTAGRNLELTQQQKAEAELVVEQAQDNRNAMRRMRKLQYPVSIGKKKFAWKTAPDETTWLEKMEDVVQTNGGGSLALGFSGFPPQMIELVNEAVKRKDEATQESLALAYQNLLGVTAAGTAQINTGRGPSVTDAVLEREENAMNQIVSLVQDGGTDKEIEDLLLEIKDTTNLSDAQAAATVEAARNAQLKTRQGGLLN